MNWRGFCKPIIETAIKENPTTTDKEIKKILKPLYPFGEREYYPYKVWLDEIKKQLKARARMKESPKLHFPKEIK